jgi:hypothetical protein
MAEPEMTEQQNSFGDLFGSLFGPWAKAWETAGSQDGPFALAMAAFDPRRWLGMYGPAMEQPFDTLLGSPRFAFPMLDRKLLAVGAGWLMLLQRNGEYSARLVRAWSEANGELLSELNDAAAKGEPVHAGRELLDRFIAVVNRKMQNVQRSEEFLASQRRLLEAFLSSRTRERELIELLANAFDLPTRTEIDDAHRSVHDLKREVRALRREIERLQGETAADRSAGRSATVGVDQGEPPARARGG